MKEGWGIRKLEDTIQDVVYTTKVKSSDYKKIGLFPVISQEQQLISGYWDNPDDVFKVNKPIVVFGDHTKEVKYIDFDFVLGADGVKILLPINEIDSKYYFYYIKSLKISSLGYARHYRFLK